MYIIAIRNFNSIDISEKDTKEGLHVNINNQTEFIPIKLEILSMISTYFRKMLKWYNEPKKVIELKFNTKLELQALIDVIDALYKQTIVFNDDRRLFMFLYMNEFLGLECFVFYTHLSKLDLKRELTTKRVKEFNFDNILEKIITINYQDRIDLYRYLDYSNQDNVEIPKRIFKFSIWGEKILRLADQIACKLSTYSTRDDVIKILNEHTEKFPVISNIFTKEGLLSKDIVRYLNKSKYDVSNFMLIIFDDRVVYQELCDKYNNSDIKYGGWYSWNIV